MVSYPVGGFQFPDSGFRIAGFWFLVCCFCIDGKTALQRPSVKDACAKRSWLRSRQQTSKPETRNRRDEETANKKPETRNPETGIWKLETINWIRNNNIYKLVMLCGPQQYMEKQENIYTILKTDKNTKQQKYAFQILVESIESIEAIESTQSIQYP